MFQFLQWSLQLKILSFCNILHKSDFTYRVEYIEERVTCRKSKVFTQELDATNCQEHGNRWAEGKEMAGVETELGELDERNPSPSPAHQEVDWGTRGGGEQGMAENRKKRRYSVFTFYSLTV